MTLPPKSIIPIIGLTAALAMGPVAPEVGNALFLTSGGLALTLIWPGMAGQLQRPLFWMLLVALGLIAMAYAASAGLDGLVGLAYFAPLIAVLPLVAVLRGADLRAMGLLVGILALCGAAGAALTALIEVHLTGTQRAGGSVANPIHFADVALLVGFLALTGMAFTRSYWRLLFAAGPLLGVTAVVLSGTRGAVIAVLAMALAAAISATVMRLLSLRIAIVGALCVAILGGLFLAVGGSQISGIERVLSDITETLSYGVPTDGSTSLRLQMYLGGLRAFLESPFVGHGPLAFTAVADSLADVPFGGSPHLHSDLIDLGASAGLLGLAAYVLMMLAPILEALRMPRSTHRSWTVMLSITLITGYFVMGLTNAMFGILTVTVTYAAICVVIGMFASAPEPDAA